MRMCQDSKNAKGLVMHQVALQSKVTKAQKMGTDKVEQALYRNNEQKMEQHKWYETSDKKQHSAFNFKNK